MLVLALEFSRNSATRSGCPVISTVHAGAQDERLRAHPGHRRSAAPSREWLDGAGADTRSKLRDAYAASSGDDTKGRSLKTEERGPTSIAGTGVCGRRAPLDVVAADHLPVCDERRITSVQLGSVRSEWTGMTP